MVKIVVVFQKGPAMLRLITALFVLLAAPVAAQDYPLFHNVTGVAANDVLNVRAAPNAGAPILHVLPPDAQWVEVVEVQGNWGRINFGEGSGWASLRFLTPVADGNLPEYPYLTCFGTEPFWGLDLTMGAQAVLSQPDGASETFLLGNMRAAAGRPDVFAVQGSTADADLVVTIAARQCSDGMSDALYGLEGTVVIGGDDPRVLAGCCSLR
jgi:uncharacterized membrane protein